VVRSSHVALFEHEHGKEAHRIIAGELEVDHSSLERKRVFSL
jgi:hypothetical protein